MKKKIEKTSKQENLEAVVEKGRGRKDTLFCLLFSVVLSAIITIVFISLCYKGSFALIGKDIVVIWLIVTALFLSSFIYSYLLNNSDRKSITVIGIAVVVSTVFTALIIRYLSFYFALLSLGPLLVVLLLSRKEAYVTNFLLSTILLLMAYVYYVNFMQSNDFGFLYLVLIKSIASMGMIITYRTSYNRLRVIAVGTLYGFLSFVLGFLISLLAINVDFVESVMNGIWMMVAELISTLLCLVLAPIIEWVFRLETSMQFLEYISFDQPLLKELAQKAPGTFNHSVQVGNLAERCAYAIGENVNVAKAAAYFHDIGKMQSPEFFTENQSGGYNPHDDLIFETSVKIITRHTEIGYQMLTEAKFPKIICDVAREHHGDSSLSYFYIKAQNITEGDVDRSDYSYPGPRPSTRISAIITIADSVEAASRSMGLRDRDAIFGLVDKIIREKRESGQFNDCDITMNQLAIIQDTLVESLVGSAHKRISYPQRKDKN